jgi:signal transduction histidine kinase
VNLVSNGFKHTPKGSPLRVVVTRVAQGARVEVRDRGTGVAPDYRAKIFEKFGTIEARHNRSYHSVGLGLAFCKLAVEAHGGTIGVDDGVPTGSNFWFTLPDAQSPSSSA